MIGLVVAAVLVVLAAGGAGVMLYLNGKSDVTFAINSCVKKSGDTAVSAKCSEEGSYKVVTKTTAQANCPDQEQPSVFIERDGGKTEVFCLRPANE
ncbi:MAG: hypothetical protein HKP61_11695 [Dactylosporangium sp.]|nr:hypothetical protein [Dactylosporangium sp.]NNJ61586.1 hypothetical protein [Dactylosporangium sp.]